MSEEIPGEEIPVEEVTAHFEVRGVVQGVGFRPFVHRTAIELGLRGHVGNDASSVFIEVQGAAEAVDELARRLVHESPPLARVDDVVRRPRSRALPAVDGFTIVRSRAGVGTRTLIPPDTSVCDDCVRELFDPDDRRHRHPFITCTSCGPRFTIIRELPYDRPATTMAGFAMCDECAAEYRDPADRRHHAQPIACHACGPVLRFELRGGAAPATEDAVGAAQRALAAGAILAVKGIGGFHLVCDATDDAAIRRLRERKHRPDKPFAVMVGSVEQAAELVHLDAVERAELTSPARPVVLARALRGGMSGISSLVAPANPFLGLMLPYSPIHHLLFDGRPVGWPAGLVMTSANRGGEPIVHRDEDLHLLDDLCDGALTHDRPIHLPCDDSVVRVVDGHLLPIRRARGFAPLPVDLPGARRSVVAVGGELKATFCVASGGHAWISQHLGDMASFATNESFESVLDHFLRLHGIEPDLVAADAHPGYRSTRWAHAHHAGRVVEVQHHHAHVASAMAEHRLDPHTPVIGVAFDGTGYGDDGTIWGGEFLLADVDGFERVAHLVPVPVPGGDVAVLEPCRSALAHLHGAGVDWAADLPPVDQFDPTALDNLRVQLDGGFACTPTSSMGRLFDGVASLLGLRHRISFEAQAAVDLELAATGAGHGDRPYRFVVDGARIHSDELVRAIVDDVRGGVGVGAIATGFHRAVVDLVVRVCERTRDERGIDSVVLTGGTFQNALLTAACRKRLSGAGFRVLTHRLVPPNDGGLSLGQAYIVAHAAEPLRSAGYGRRP